MGSVYKGQPRWKSSGVDWKAYTKAIENSVNLIELRKIFKVLSEEFQKITTGAAKRHVGTTKPGKEKFFWVTPAVNNVMPSRKRIN